MGGGRARIERFGEEESHTLLVGAIDEFPIFGVRVGKFVGQPSQSFAECLGLPVQFAAVMRLLASTKMFSNARSAGVRSVVQRRSAGASSSTCATEAEPRFCRA